MDHCIGCRFPTRRNGLGDGRSPLPAFADEALIRDRGVIIDDSAVWLEISLGGFRVGVRWTIERIEGSRVTVATESTLDAEFNTRGAYNNLVGEISGEFVMDVFDPFATTGSIAFVGTYKFGDADQVDYREGWTLTTTPPG